MSLHNVMVPYFLLLIPIALMLVARYAERVVRIPTGTQS